MPESTATNAASYTTPWDTIIAIVYAIECVPMHRPKADEFHTGTGHHVNKFFIKGKAANPINQDPHLHPLPRFRG